MSTTPTIWKTPFTANDGGLVGTQSYPRTIGLANGNILVVWTDDTNGSQPGQDIVGQLFNPLGERIGGLFDVNKAFPGGDQLYPEIAAMPDGGFVMVYQAETYPYGKFLAVERFDSAGQSIASNKIFGVFFSGWAVTVNAAGDYIVAFEKNVGSGDNLDIDVHAFVFDHATNQPGAEHVNTTQNAHENSTTDDDHLAGIATFANGDIIAVSDEADASFPRYWSSAEFRITSPTGANLVGHTEVGGDSGHNAFADDVVVLTNDTFVFAYSLFLEDDPNVVAFRIGTRNSPTQVTLSPEFRPFQAVSESAQVVVVRLVALQDGTFFIAWSTADSQISGAHYASNGVRIGGVLDIAGGGLSDLSRTADGRVLVAYTTNKEPTEVIVDPRDSFIVGDDSANVIAGQINGTQVFGEGGADRIYGVNGFDILSGGTGNDTVSGGQGDDIIHGDEDNDNLIGDEGNDTLYGDDGSDQLNGANGNDRLDGGAGVDTLAGGQNDDTYILSSVSLIYQNGFFTSVYDTVAEQLNEGADSVFITPISRGPSSYTLTDNVENGVIVGSLAFTLTGNSLANYLTGNTAANTLNGGDGGDTLDGGTGIDTLVGGAGNDFYFVRNSSSTVTEAANGGADRVYAYTSFDLSTRGANVELLIANAAGILMTGNDLGNTILGTSGSETLAGKLGLDTLTGNAGADTFVFNTAANAANFDTITDFSHVDDTIQLSKTAFAALAGAAGSGLLAAQFNALLSTAAYQADDRIIYQTDTGKLFYDVDGYGGTAAVQIALLSTKPQDVAANDFLLIA